MKDCCCGKSSIATAVYTFSAVLISTGAWLLYVGIVYMANQFSFSAMYTTFCGGSCIGWAICDIIFMVMGMQTIKMSCGACYNHPGVTTIGMAVVPSMVHYFVQTILLIIVANDFIAAGYQRSLAVSLFYNISCLACMSASIPFFLSWDRMEAADLDPKIPGGGPVGASRLRAQQKAEEDRRVAAQNQAMAEIEKAKVEEQIRQQEQKQLEERIRMEERARMQGAAANGDQV